MHSYNRKTFYHETDQMGIIHHSNYIRWFEEARVHWMNEIGLSYKQLEEEGLLSPVLKISCEYKAMTRFDEDIIIHVEPDSYNGVRYFLKYEVRGKEDDVVHAFGESSHCFINKENRPVSVKKVRPDMHKVFLKIFEA